LTNLIFMHLVCQPYQTTNLMLLAIGAGCFFLSLAWLLLFYAATFAGWAVIAATAPPEPTWLHFGFALVTATGLSAIIYSVRVRTFQRLESLRLQDLARQENLEEALAQTEKSRGTLAASRTALEFAIRATRQSESRFRQTSETLHALITASPLAIFALDSSLTVQTWNDAAERLFGWRLEEVLAHPLPIPLELPGASEGLLERMLRGESLTDVEARCQVRDGQWIDVSFSAAPLHGAHGSPAGVVAVVTDITERKRAEENARSLLLEQVARAQAEEAQQRLTFLAEASRWLGSSLDFETTLERAARLGTSELADWCMVAALDEQTSFHLTVACADPSKEEVAHQLQRHQPRDPAHGQPPRARLRAGRTEMAAQIPDDLLMALAGDTDQLQILRQLSFQSYIGVPLITDGRWLGAIFFIAAESGRQYGPDDLTLAEELASRAALAMDNARLLRELRAADQRKDEFLAMLAHELRNPVGAISNAVQFLRRFGPGEPRLSRPLETIEHEVEHQARLLDDLMDVSRITRGKIVLRLARLDLAALVRDTIEDRRGSVEAAGVTLSLELPENPVWVRGDPTRLSQVVGNLLQNAAKFTNPGGFVRVRLEANADAAMAVLTISDTGIGIEPEMLRHIFETFVQADLTSDRSRGGLGLGLAMVKGLVELHCGEVQAESAGAGRGSQFTVRLPLTSSPDTTLTSSQKTGPEATDARPLRILIVEDNRAAAETLRDLLERSGHTLEVTTTGLAAVPVARAFRPEVVLCDLGLPGLDGYQVAQQLRRHPLTAAARLIAITGYGQEGDRRRSQEAGFEQHLTKPIDFDELRRLLANPPAQTGD
jgi:PAS domain S-box-containing protein